MIKRFVRFFYSAWTRMINVLIDNFVFSLLVLLAIVHSNEIFPCNLTNHLHEDEFRVQYQTKTIQDGMKNRQNFRLSWWWYLEFLVQFTGYYMENTRSNYLQHIFQRLNVSDYRIIQRNNLMQHYPSDFDIVRVSRWFSWNKSSLNFRFSLIVMNRWLMHWKNIHLFELFILIDKFFDVFSIQEVSCCILIDFVKYVGSCSRRWWEWNDGK